MDGKGLPTTVFTANERLFVFICLQLTHTLEWDIFFIQHHKIKNLFYNLVIQVCVYVFPWIFDDIHGAYGRDNDTSTNDSLFPVPCILI